MTNFVIDTIPKLKPLLLIPNPTHFPKPATLMRGLLR